MFLTACLISNRLSIQMPLPASVFRRQLRKNHKSPGWLLDPDTNNHRDSGLLNKQIGGIMKHYYHIDHVRKVISLSILLTLIVTSFAIAGPGKSKQAGSNWSPGNPHPPGLTWPAGKPWPWYVPKKDHSNYQFWLGESGPTGPVFTGPHQYPFICSTFE